MGLDRQGSLRIIGDAEGVYRQMEVDIGKGIAVRMFPKSQEN